MNKIEKQLQFARQNLLDFTMRNRLLNFRPTKARTIKTIDEIPTEIYNILVLQEKKMEFRSVKKKIETNTEDDEDIYTETADHTENEVSKLWELSTPDVEVAERYVDRFLQTSLESEALQKRLFYINQQSKSVFEEQGYTVLYLALGFLEWTEDSNSDQTRSSPLILIPVELERTKVGKSFKLYWTEEDIFTNISLQAKLSEQGILLPDFEMPDGKTGIDQYFKSVVDEISNMQNWRVVSDIYLDFFSFTKFVMYKDLDSNGWPEGKSPIDHPLIKSIFDPSEKQDMSEFSEDEVDAKLNFFNLYHVMDADPSQIAVIEDVKASKNLVVEGPPGTGKSQTITNIIAELLADGKSVLFVSEKMAALEVVKSRLDHVGLGDFCLELHSRKSNKKEVLAELQHTISKPPPKSISLDKDFEKLDSLKSELNGYVKALNEPFGILEEKPFSLFNMKEKASSHFEKLDRDMPRIKLSDVEKCNYADFANTKSELSNLAEILQIVKPISNHPWKGCSPDSVLPSDETEIDFLINECNTSINDIEAIIEKLTEFCSIKRPVSFKELEQAISASKVIAASKPTDKDVLLSSKWNEPSHEANELIQKIEEYHKLCTQVLKTFERDALNLNLDLIHDYRELSAKFFITRFFNGRFRQLKQEIFSLYKDVPPENNKMIISDLNELEYCIKLKTDIQDSNETGQTLFGSHWRAEESNPKMLQSFAYWVVSFRQQLLKKVFTEEIIDVVSAGISQENVERIIDDLIGNKKHFIEIRDQLDERIGINYEMIFEIESENVSFKDLTTRLDLWKSNLLKLQIWSQFATRRQSCLKTIATPIVELIDSDLLEPEDILPCFEGNFADDLLRYVFIERPVLVNFVGELHENKIKKFMELDSELILKNRQRLAHMLYQKQPRISGGASTGSEAGILLSEFGRKRRHMPIRKLMKLTGGLIQKIKPCFMMSPLSIAQFLDPKTANFDVVIFDEASQVKPEDALGALLRGNQAVVIGDTRQLPPTSFFDHMVESDEDDDPELGAPIADIESILHLCKSSFITKILRWHYRSRHESLIAVSNQEFYDNRLVIYPSPNDKMDHIGLKFIHLPDTIYDRGGSSVNRKEARTVAKMAIEHYRNYPNKSLGIGAFNIKQQQAILEEIELQIREHPEMEDFLKSDRYEHFFVKNLETIQGDERDFIFLSIGFGFDKSGRLSHNFGPVNRDGGERRLNVLITRAREQCVVFSNFQAKDLSLDANPSFGLRSLKVFLDYAENRNLISMESISEDADSPFEESVYDFLRDNGFEVRKQVGCAGYRVDLGVINPESPGRYLMGIECDGAKYHSSPVARDRDRLRQQILEGLGWNIYRVWSTDWYRNRIETKNKLLKAVKKAKRMNDNSIAIQENRPEITIERHEKEVQIEEETSDSTSVETLNDIVHDYEVCPPLAIETFGEFSEVSLKELAKAVSRIVEVEGPIHLDEVIRRIRSDLGYKRTGYKIRDAIIKAAALAKREGNILRKSDFLWPVNNQVVPVRRRGGDLPAKIDLICDEEIAEAIKLVLKNQFATFSEELVLQSSRLLGFRATSEVVANRIDSIIRKMIKQKELKHLPNEMIDLA
jgi:superfamily I DNA and/or RNA helicase/very-short-patch-repair endonuclease